MKIKSIRYGNFRNFADEGEIIFATDGAMTIVYGTNGDGKTTLHQLFQWVLYGRVNFNRTTSADKLYNLERGKRLREEFSFKVWGQIEFEHNEENYLVRREWEYYKGRNGDIVHKTAGDNFYVQRQVREGDWRELEMPNAVIEEVLPSGLAPYFFFDGETMIADLKIRGTDSAKTLKKALYSIFELEIYEKALVDIGNDNAKLSAIGRLCELKRKAQESAAKIEKQKKNQNDLFKAIRILINKLEVIEEETEDCKKRIEEKNKRINEISEEIGTTKSKKQLEKSRLLLKDSRDTFNANIEKVMLSFGKEVSGNYAYLLITDVVKDAGERLYMQVQNEEKKIIPGLTKELLINLLKRAGSECICGHEIGSKELSVLEEWKGYFPPASYKSTYDKFTRNAVKYSGSYNEDRLLVYFKEILELKSKIKNSEAQISAIDKELSSVGNIDDLIDERKKLEDEIEELTKTISNNNKLKGEFEVQKRSAERSTQKIGTANSEVQKYDELIELLKAVSVAIKGILNSETSEYSWMLQREIQNLIDNMLTSKRKVSLTEDFQLQVRDSYGDESKSEGQFAVISFAYIGGILKVLKSHEKLKGKEYPLVLDGPFSKLDEEQKRNVLTVIPQYAPQVIIFSKDPLEDFVEDGTIGKTWTISSNEEKNYAAVEEGFLWN